MAEEAKTPYVNINGIPKGLVHERQDKEGKTFYNVGVQVPYSFSKNGLANVTVNKVFECKSDPDKVNIGFPKDWTLKVSVCTYQDKDDSKNNKYETKEMTPNQLLTEHINYLNVIKEKSGAKEAAEEAADKEDDGVEMG